MLGVAQCVIIVLTVSSCRAARVRRKLPGPASDATSKYKADDSWMTRVAPELFTTTTTSSTAIVQATNSENLNQTDPERGKKKVVGTVVSSISLKHLWEKFMCFSNARACGKLAYLAPISDVIQTYKSIIDATREVVSSNKTGDLDGADHLGDDTTKLLKWMPPSYKTRKYLHSEDSPFRKRILNPPSGKIPLLRSKKILVVGAGPAGLRLAIEARMMGAAVTVIDSRNQFNRANVLKLWTFTKHDLLSLGMKQLWSAFARNPVILSIPISYMQHGLLRAALVLGIDVIPECQFHSMLENTTGTGIAGTSCTFDPLGFDVVVDGSGARGIVRSAVLPGESRPIIPSSTVVNIAKYAITVNFKHYKGDSADEIPGASKQFFVKRFESKEVQLDNIAYYRSPISHYVVATVPKSELLEKGVFRKDRRSVGSLLSRENINKDALLETSITIAKDWGVPHSKGILGGDPETGSSQCSVFEFARRMKAEEQYRVHAGGKKVVVLVGDSLLAPFWPDGTGANRAVISAYHAAWTLVEALDGDVFSEEAIQGRGVARAKALKENTYSTECEQFEFEAFLLRGYGTAIMHSGGKGGIPAKRLYSNVICGLSPSESWGM